jgi:regulation of enolase protein 1 (concanavalin A-like superfamily)
MLGSSTLVTPILAADVQFRDDFDSSLQPGWQWIDPKGDCTKTLDIHQSFLQIATASGRHDLWTERNDFYAPRLMREMDGDFTLETKAMGTRHDGGLLVWKNARNYVRFERGIHFKNNLYFGAAVDGNFIMIANDYVEGDAIWLRLERKSSTYSASYSLDGQQWRPISRQFIGLKRAVAQNQEDWMERLNEYDFEFGLAKGSVEMSARGPLLVGLTALSKGPTSVAEYDYFEIRGK